MSATAGVIDSLLVVARQGGRPQDAEALSILPGCPADALLETAEALTLEGYGHDVSYSRKVFIPLTRLCRDVCRYCTFAEVPRRQPKAYLDIDEVVAIEASRLTWAMLQHLLTVGEDEPLQHGAQLAVRELVDPVVLEVALLDLLEREAGVLEHTGVLDRELDLDLHVDRGTRRLAVFGRRFLRLRPRLPLRSLLLLRFAACSSSDHRNAALGWRGPRRHSASG